MQSLDKCCGDVKLACITATVLLLTT